MSTLNARQSLNGVSTSNGISEQRRNGSGGLVAQVTSPSGRPRHVWFNSLQIHLVLIFLFAAGHLCGSYGAYIGAHKPYCEIDAADPILLAPHRQQLIRAGDAKIGLRCGVWFPHARSARGVRDPGHQGLCRRLMGNPISQILTPHVGCRTRSGPRPTFPTFIHSVEVCCKRNSC